MWDCYNEIESIYVPFYTNNLTKLDRKGLSKIAFLHFRQSDIPENDTFTREDLRLQIGPSATYAIKEDAKAYFEHMSAHIHPSEKMKDPKTYCQKKGLVQRIAPDGSRQTDESICLNQFTALGAPIVDDQHKDEILKWIFKNIKYDELIDGQIKYDHVWTYVKHVSLFFKAKENEMKLPWHFCATRYPETQKEEEIKS